MFRKSLIVSTALSMLLVFVLMTFGAMPQAAKPPSFTTWTVCQSGGCDFTSIQQAIDDPSVLDDDVVLVSDGTYVETIDFSGKAITVVSENGAEYPDGTPRTIIDGSGDPVSVLTFQSGEGPQSILDGFTITNGNPSYPVNGGGINIRGSSPTIRNCTVSGNVNMSTHGGGMYIYDGSPTIEDCKISGNSSVGSGGGIQCNGINSMPTITRCTISGNSCDAYGAGINLSQCSPVISDSIISGNTSTVSGSGGGGIWIHAASATITNTIIADNSIYNGGGIMFWDSTATATITNTIISGNTATYSGGGIYGGDTQFDITNCTIADNTAGNTPSADGIHNGFGTITNSIVYYNGETEINRINGFTITYSDIQQSDPNDPTGMTPLPGGGNILDPPMFVQGGCEPTNYYLDAASPCIDAGINSGAPSNDICGIPRPLDGLGDDTAVADMGAYEFQLPSACGIIVTEALYDYLSDTIDVKAMSPSGQSADLKLLLEGYPDTDMQWKKQGGYWYTMVMGISPSPAVVTVWGPVDNCQTTE